MVSFAIATVRKVGDKFVVSMAIVGHSKHLLSVMVNTHDEGVKLRDKLLKVFNDAVVSVGTGHYATLSAARKEYGSETEAALREGRISIGLPAFDPGDSAVFLRDDRYHIARLSRARELACKLAGDYIHG